MSNAEAAAILAFLIRWSGSVCPVCGRALITLDELKRARWGRPGDVVHQECWSEYERAQQEKPSNAV